MYLGLVSLSKPLPLLSTSFPNHRLIIILSIYAISLVLGATENFVEVIINKYRLNFTLKPVMKAQNGSRSIAVLFL
jgi:hypothetical protein